MKNLTTGHSLKLIFFFALPLMFGNLLQQLYIMVDTMIVGRFVGVDALASLVGQIWDQLGYFRLLMWLFTCDFHCVSTCLGLPMKRNGKINCDVLSFMFCNSNFSYHFFTNNYRTFIKTIKYTKSYNSRIYYLFKNHVWWSFNCNLL